MPNSVDAHRFEFNFFKLRLVKLYSNTGTSIQCCTVVVGQIYSATTFFVMASEEPVIRFRSYKPKDGDLKNETTGDSGEGQAVQLASVEEFLGGEEATALLRSLRPGQHLLLSGLSRSRPASPQDPSSNKSIDPLHRGNIFFSENNEYLQRLRPLLSI